MIEIKSGGEEKGPKILVIGVGGGGNNAINRMIEAKLKGIHFAAINTDVAVLDNSMAEHKVQIGTKLLKGYGAGADPDLGEAAAKENEEDIRRLIEKQNMVIITCGMGGGTGTGAAPFIARCCRELNILTLAVVTTPFTFENRPRMMAAQSGLDKLREHIDTLLVIPNEKLLTISDRPLMLDDAFAMADSVLKDIIQGISNIVYNCGNINIDYNDVKTSLQNKGIGHFGIGKVDYDGSILEAIKQAVNCPLLETTIIGAENILINTSGRVSVTALSDALNYVRNLAGENVNIIWGTVSGEGVQEDQIVVSLFATGMPENKEEKISPFRAKLVMPKKPQSNSEILKEIRFNQSDKKLTNITEQMKVQTQHKLEVPTFLTDYFRSREH